MFHAEVVRRDGEAGRLHPRRLVRPHARRRGRPRDDRGRRADRPSVDRRRHVGGRDRRAGTYPAIASLRPLFDPKNEKIKR